MPPRSGLQWMLVVIGLALALLAPNAVSVFKLAIDFRAEFITVQEARFKDIQSRSFGVWKAETRVCPYSTAYFSLSKLLGLPGKYRENLGAEDTNGIVFRRQDGESTFLAFMREELDLCTN